MIGLLFLGIGVLLYAACAIAAGALLLTLPNLSVFGLDLNGFVVPALVSWAVITLILGALAARIARNRRGQRAADAAG